MFLTKKNMIYKDIHAKFFHLIPFASVVFLAIIVGTFNGIFSCVALFLSILAIVFFPEEDSLCLLFFLMPFANIFKFSATSQSFLTYLLLFFVLWHFFKKRSINIAFLVAFLFFVSFLLLQMFISIDLFRTIKFVANILFVYFAINAKTSNNNRKIFLFYILGISLSSIIAISNTIPNLNAYIGAKDLGYEYGELARFSGLFADPNYYSTHLIASLCLIVILDHKKQLHAIFSIVLAILLVVFAILTFSKSAFLMLLLPLALFLYSKIKSKKYIAFCLLFLISLILIGATLTGEIQGFETILSRFEQGDDVSSITSGRSTIWLEYLSDLMNSYEGLFFGKGFGAPLVNEHATHNTYIDFLYYLGIFGTLLLGVLFFSLIRTKKTVSQRNILNYSIWICISIMYFFLSELFYFDWPFHIIIAILVFKTPIASKHEG